MTKGSFDVVIRDCLTRFSPIGQQKIYLVTFLSFTTWVPRPHTHTCQLTSFLDTMSKLFTSSEPRSLGWCHLMRLGTLNWRTRRNISQLHLQLWWQIFNNLVRPQLNKQVSSSENTNLVCLETVTSADYMETPPSPEKRPPPVDTRQNWESGTPDCLGSASFENILKKIDQTIKDRENQAK